MEKKERTREHMITKNTRQIVVHLTLFWFLLIEITDKACYRRIHFRKKRNVEDILSICFASQCTKQKWKKGERMQTWVAGRSNLTTSEDSKSGWNRSSKESALKRATTGVGKVEEEEEGERCEIDNKENSCCLRVCPNETSIAATPKLYSAVWLCTVEHLGFLYRAGSSAPRSLEPPQGGATKINKRKGTGERPYSRSPCTYKDLGFTSGPYMVNGAHQTNGWDVEGAHALPSVGRCHQNFKYIWWRVRLYKAPSLQGELGVYGWTHLDRWIRFILIDRLPAEY